MTEKEEILLKTIYKYFKKNKLMPTQRTLQNMLKYKSVNSITQYIKSLEKKGYLIRNYNRLVLSNTNCDSDIRYIKLLNCKNKYIKITVNKKKNYTGFKLNNNSFNKDNIIKGDILIIENTKNLNTDNIGLFLIDNKYRIMKYQYKDGFYFLTDKETIILNHVKIIGKVIQIIRKI